MKLLADQISVKVESEPDSPLFVALSQITVRSVDHSGDSNSQGLATPISPELLQSFCSLPGSLLVVARYHDQAIGFCLLHLDPQGFPEPIQPYISLLNPVVERVGACGYGHLVAVLPEFRGDHALVYTLLHAHAKKALGPKITWMFMLVRNDNLRALAAHKKLGWVDTKVKTIIEIPDRKLTMIFLVISLTPELESQSIATLLYSANQMASSSR